MAGLKSLLKRTPLRLAHSYVRALAGRKSQSDESLILGRLVQATDAPKTFVEFGFNIHQFNCIELAKSYRGLLLDGDEGGVRVARHFLPTTVEAKSLFLTLDNLDVIESRFPVGELGVLSIDVDGNDYWFLERLLGLEPAVASVEYNASMGLRPITVPYDPKFVRNEKHPSGWYHGASITALTHLCATRGYDLVAVDSGGANAFFARADRRPDSLQVQDPRAIYRENQLRNAWSGTTAEAQWEVIGELPFVTVS